MRREFEVEHEGEVYWVEVEFSTHTVDDSFDGHLGGVVHTFEDSHREVDSESIEIVSCTDGEGEEVDFATSPGLDDLIVETTEHLDVDD